MHQQFSKQKIIPDSITKCHSIIHCPSNVLSLSPSLTRLSLSQFSCPESLHFSTDFLQNTKSRLQHRKHWLAISMSSVLHCSMGHPQVDENNISRFSTRNEMYKAPNFTLFHLVPLSWLTKTADIRNAPNTHTHAVSVEKKMGFISSKNEMYSKNPRLIIQCFNLLEKNPEVIHYYFVVVGTRFHISPLLYDPSDM